MTSEQEVVEAATEHGLMADYTDPEITGGLPFGLNKCGRCSAVLVGKDRHVAWHRETTAQIRLAMFLAMAAAEKVREHFEPEPEAVTGAD